MKKLLVFLLLILSHPSFSSNLLGGEITCRNINGLMYETTLTIYRDTISGNLPLNYTITYCDSVDTVIATHIVATTNGLLQWNGYKSYKYIDTINFASCGTFWVSARDCFRDTIINIANSTSYGMYIDCMVMVDGSNSTPNFLSVPITIAQLNQSFSYNTTPYDQDGDSLSWELCTPEDLYTSPVTGLNYIIPTPYTYPSSNILYPFHIDTLTGDILFKPNLAGKFQIAVKINEWRNGVLIGYVKRDMVLNVVQSSNVPNQVYCQMYTAAASTSYWYQGTQTPTWFLTVPQLLTLHFNAFDTITHSTPDCFIYGSALINTSAWTLGGGANDWYDSYFYFPASSMTLRDNPYFITFRIEDYYGVFKFYKDYTFRIFVTNTSTGIDEINNETKSVYLKSIDMLGREKDPNLPGFRIDLYSDGTTKKVFRGE
ncbi:MAG: hypothetical protein ACKOX3_02775 [Bacteroidota bacterium]